MLESIKEILGTFHHGALSNVDENGNPDVRLMKYIYIEHETKPIVYLFCRKESHKLVGLKQNPKVCYALGCHLDTFEDFLNNKQLRFYGEVKLASDMENGEEFTQEVMKMAKAKYPYLDKIVGENYHMFEGMVLEYDRVVITDSKKYGVKNDQTYIA